MEILRCFSLTMRAGKVTASSRAAPGHLERVILANPIATDIVMTEERAVAGMLADGLCSCVALHSS
jgi:hypothetical protein